MKPRVCVLRTDGTNADEELFYTFEKFGAQPEYVHVNELRNKSKKLKNYHILALPGGFAYGDDVASGKILAVELMSYLKNEMQNFVEKKGLVIGICNGFQTLVRTGLLPFTKYGQMDVTLSQNESGHFECRWVKIKPQKSKCVFLNGQNDVFEIAVNHGEGRLYAKDDIISKLEKDELVIFRYVDDKGKPTNQYPENPNGSTNAIAGLCNETGRIIGMMPHPEKFVDITQYPNWRRNLPAGRQVPNAKPPGEFVIKNMVIYAKEN